jgi:uncharacterized delta-60 repeat protein
MVIDSFGNVYVTGVSASATNADYATVKYNLSGAEQWVARYNGPVNSNDIANAIAVDSSGNVYVTGQSLGSGTNYDYATIKYDSSGGEQWVTRYNGAANSVDVARAAAVDSSGNVYVTGYSYNGTGTVYDYVTIKYNPGGVQQWVAKYNGPGSSADNANAIAVDSSGNVYVAGWSMGSGTSYDFATVKYNSSGDQLWVARYNGPANVDDQAGWLALDPSGNVYVTGYGTGSGTDKDFTTIKYNSSGGEQWVARYDGPANSIDVAHAIALDPSGNVYVTGSSFNISDDYATIKYNSSGGEQWVARYDGPASDYETSTAIAVDSEGNVYVTGQSTGSGTDLDFATIKYDTNGGEQWAERHDNASGADGAKAVSVDSSGNVYVAGYSMGSGTDNDYAAIKYFQAPNETTPAGVVGGVGQVPESPLTVLAIVGAALAIGAAIILRGNKGDR